MDFSEKIDFPRNGQNGPTMAQNNFFAFFEKFMMKVHICHVPT